MAAGGKGGARRQAAQARHVVRIADVARVAGVSTATVSRALSAPAQVTPAKRDKVMAAVRSLGYTPNAAARDLRARSSRSILVVTGTRANPFFAQVLEGLSDTLSAEGYAVVMGTCGSEAQTTHLLDLVHAGRLDGVVAVSGKLPAAGGRTVFGGKVPVVSICAEVEGAINVLVDDFACAKAQAEHLIGLGHRRLLYIAGPEGNYNELRRFAGFLAATERAGLFAGDVFRFSGDFLFSGGAAAALRFLDLPHRPTGVVCCNDEMAIGFIKTLRVVARIEVPRDVSVVGFDGIEFADYCEPTLTTIHQPQRALGETSARLLLAALRGEAPPPGGRVVLEARLRVAASTGRAG